jgi:hypothetical protein
MSEEVEQVLGSQMRFCLSGGWRRMWRDKEMAQGIKGELVDLGFLFG